MVTANSTILIRPITQSPGLGLWLDSCLNLCLRFRLRLRLRLVSALWLGLGLLLGSGGGLAQPALPNLGDRISGTVSLEQEYVLGQEFLRQIRRGAPTIPDPLLNAYLENLTYKIAAQSQLRDHRLSFVIIDSEELNAFAAPGGIIGINSGLFIESASEAEFASVMAHEIAHLSQRHYARGIDEAKQNRVPQLATVLASVLIMATSDPAHGLAALTGAQGLALEDRLRYSRSNETEADRVGQDTMHAAGFDPRAMSTMFGRLMANSRFDSRPPEYLLSHPVSETRVAESRSRAGRYLGKDYNDSLEYHINRARVLAHYAEDKSALVAEWERRVAVDAPGSSAESVETSNPDSTDSADEFDITSSGVTASAISQGIALATDPAGITRDANRYALAVAYWEAGRYEDAHDTLAPLLVKESNRISYVVTQAEILVKQDRPRQAAEYLRRHLTISPGNHPLTMAYVDALQEARDYQQAAVTMEQQTSLRPDDQQLWYELAETQGQAGNIRKVHEARAEYFTLVGGYESAAEQWGYALRIAGEEDEAESEIIRLEQKILDVAEMWDAARGRR
ncbi:MAG: M48 family metalloprotease [Pseudohongiellaceae bacterium]